jgi:hypothetical protein
LDCVLSVGKAWPCIHVLHLRSRLLSCLPSSCYGRITDWLLRTTHVDYVYFPNTVWLFLCKSGSTIIITVSARSWDIAVSPASPLCPSLGGCDSRSPTHGHALYNAVFFVIDLI